MRHNTSLAQPIGGDAVADLVNLAGSVAMWNDAREWHPQAECVGALLDVPGIDAGCDDTNAHLAGTGMRVGHLAYDQHVFRWSLLFVPSCFHAFSMRIG